MFEVKLGLLTTDLVEVSAPWYGRVIPSNIGTTDNRTYMQGQWYVPAGTRVEHTYGKPSQVNGLPLIAAALFINGEQAPAAYIYDKGYDLVTLFPENTLTVVIPIALLVS